MLSEYLAKYLVDRLADEIWSLFEPRASELERLLQSIDAKLDRPVLVDMRSGLELARIGKYDAVPPQMPSA